MMRDRLTHAIVEDDRYELLEGPCYHFESAGFDTSRRGFLQILGAGLLLSMSPAGVNGQQRRSRGGREGRATGISERIHVGEDRLITVMTGKVEVGQGARTQITQAAAEELRVTIDRVRLIMGDTALCPDDGGTSGSGTTPRTIPSIRSAAAAARELLIDLAAERLKAERSSLSVRDGTITDATSHKSITYGELAKAEGFASAMKSAAGNNAAVTRVDEWKVLGTPAPKVGGSDVVTGALRYPSDIVRSDMLYGSILRPASFGAKLTSVDANAAQALEGVTIVRDGDFIGCAAKTSHLAAKAIEMIAKTAKWDSPPHPSSDGLFKYLKQHAQPGGQGRRGSRADSRGSVKDALAAAKKVIDASYEIAYIQHAPMEPRSAVAEWADGSLTVWTGTQNPMRVREELSAAFSIAPDKVRVIVPDTGGGFGGKHTGEVALEAARLARGAKRPVSVRWSREEEFTWAYFRPAGLVEIKGGLDADGKLVAWDYAMYNAGSSGIGTPYDVANVRIQSIACEPPLREGSYRALASTANAFARESFMDELAAAAGADPLDFRLKHLSEARLRDVLELAAKKFDWAGRREKQSANRGIGLACGSEKGSYAAACAEVEVDRRTGTIKVLNICQSFECGAIQNPANLQAQVEGCIIMGLGGALHEAIEFRDGRIVNARFSDYRVPRMEDLPELNIILHDHRDLASAGAGETPIIAVAPAIANAAFNATGIRIRSMPIKNEALKRT